MFYGGNQTMYAVKNNELPAQRNVKNLPGKSCFERKTEYLQWVIKYPYFYFLQFLAYENVLGSPPFTEPAPYCFNCLQQACCCFLI